MVVAFGIDVNKSLFGGYFVTLECIDNVGLLNLLMEAEELVLSGKIPLRPTKVTT